MLARLPLFYFPTTIALVDDDNAILQAMSQLISKRIGAAIKTFNQPDQCLSFFSQYKPYSTNHNLMRGLSEDELYVSADHLPVDLNSASFNMFPEDPERFNEISILISDYKMPNMSGIELFQQLKNNSFKKILLTGELDTKEAVVALNEGVIDCYINKGSPRLVDDILNYIELLTNRYLCDVSNSLLTFLETDNKLPLSNPHFIQFFKNWRSKNFIKEHHITDKFGNMLLIDQNQKRFHFLVHTDRSLDEFLEIYIENTNESNLTTSISARKKIPFFGVGQEAWQFDVETWDQYCYEPEILKGGRENYYWFVKEI